MLYSDIRRAHLRAPFSSDELDPKRRQQVGDILSALVEIDHAYEADLETVRTSDAPVTIKQRVLDNMRQTHQQRRSLYVSQLGELQNQQPGRPGPSSRWCHWSSGKGRGNITSD